MASYQVVNKHIYRTQTQDVQMGTRMDGSPNIVRQPGIMQRVEVGTILDDVTPDELATAPDRFALVDEQATKQMEGMADPGLAMNTPLRGCHEPVNAIDAAIQKPPLTGPEVAGKLAAQAEVGKVTARQTEQQTQMAKEIEEARDKAMTETVEAEVTKAREAARQAQQSRPGPRSSSPVPSALPVSTSGTPDPHSPAAASPEMHPHPGTESPTSTPPPAGTEPTPPRRRP